MGTCYCSKLIHTLILDHPICMRRLVIDGVQLHDFHWHYIIRNDKLSFLLEIRKLNNQIPNSIYKNIHGKCLVHILQHNLFPFDGKINLDNTIDFQTRQEIIMYYLQLFDINICYILANYTT